MKTNDKQPAGETPALLEKPALLAWRVAKVPQGEPSLKIGAVRCAVGAQVRLSQAGADALNSALPGCLVFEGI